MSIFNNRKILHGFPKDGQKIKFAKPSKFAWFTNTIEDEKLLEIDKEYTVKKTELNSSSSYVWLEEIDCYDEERNLPFFNLHAFTWTLPELNPKDLIGLTISDSYMINRSYGYGIKFDGKLICEGDPVLEIDYDKSNGRMTGVEYMNGITEQFNKLENIK